MSFKNLRLKYSAEEAQSMLEKDSDNNESDEETISDDQPSISNISTTTVMKKICIANQESPRKTSVQFSRNSKTWTPPLSARSVRTNPSNVVRVKPVVNPGFE